MNELLAKTLSKRLDDPFVIMAAHEDYAWGRDSWEAFKIAMMQLKPDVKVVAELCTKFQAGEYSARDLQVAPVTRQVCDDTGPSTIAISGHI